MPLKFQCQECKKFIVADSETGKKITCPECNSEVSIPDNAVDVDETPENTNAGNVNKLGKEEDLGELNQELEYRNFIGLATGKESLDYYLESFKKFENKDLPEWSRWIRWNWATFFLSGVLWFILRKMYSMAVISLIFSVLFVYFVSVPLILNLLDALDEGGRLFFWISDELLFTIVRILLLIIPPFVWALCGTNFYHDHVKYKIEKIKAENKGCNREILLEKISKAGGVNLWLTVILIHIGAFIFLMEVLF